METSNPYSSPDGSGLVAARDPLRPFPYPKRIEEGSHVERLGVETGLVDLSDMSTDELRSLPHVLIKDSLVRILRQVERPRVNLGSTGPPGRAD
jgi:hypothetical protein